MCIFCGISPGSLVDPLFFFECIKPGSCDSLGRFRKGSGIDVAFSQ